MKIFRTFLIALASFALIFGVSAPSQAAASKIYLSGKSVGVLNGQYTATASLVPKRSGVSITLYRLTLGGKAKLVSAKTNSAGKAVFKFTVKTSTLVISAQQTSKSSVKSSSKRINVQYKTNVSVVWPDEMTCGDDSAYVQVSPKLSDRAVTMQWWNAGDEMWIDESTDYTNSNGVIWFKIPNVTAGGDYYQRIYVPSSGKYLSAVSAYVLLSFPPCDESDFELTGNAQTYVNQFQYWEVDWQTTGFDSADFVGGDANVYLDVCDIELDYCDPTDEEMPTQTDVDVDYLTIYDDDYGSFTWYMSEIGDYVMRISVWDDGEMIYYRYWDLTVE